MLSVAGARNRDDGIGRVEQYGVFLGNVQYGDGYPRDWFSIRDVRHRPVISALQSGNPSRDWWDVISPDSCQPTDLPILGVALGNLHLRSEGTP